MSEHDKTHEYYQDQPKPPFPHEHLSPPGQEKEMNLKPKFKAPHYQPAGKLKGKCALITGGDSGIGKAVAYLFAKEKADVGFTFLPQEKADATSCVHEINSLGRKAFSIQTDLRFYDQCEAAVNAFIEEFGRIDILVNNAAFQKHVDDIESLSIEQWDHTFKSNIYAYFYMVKAALRFMPKGASIINTGSITGLKGSSRLLDYSATKGAIHAFTKSLAKSLLPREIRVNCVAMGPVWTPLNPAERSSQETEKFGEGVPYHRPAQPEEIAPTYVYLASEADSSFMTGEVIGLLGGETRS